MYCYTTFIELIYRICMEIDRYEHSVIISLIYSQIIMLPTYRQLICRIYEECITISKEKVNYKNLSCFQGLECSIGT